MRRLCFFVLIAAVCAGLAHPVDAAPGDRRCWLLNGVLTCGTEVETPGGPSDDPRTGGDAPTAVWIREVVGSVQGENDNGNATCATGDSQLGVYTRFTLRVIATGEVLDTYFECIPLGPAPPAPPPAAPTREELEKSVPVPLPTIAANPSGQGVTGLDSWFWADNASPVTATVSLRGWTVTGTLTPTKWVWSTGDGASYTASTPGSQADPAVEHAYQTKGSRQLAVQVSWEGSYTVSGYGTTYTVEDLVTENTATVDYPVAEIRSVLDDPAVPLP